MKEGWLRVIRACPLFLINLSFAFAKLLDSSLQSSESKSLPRGEGFREGVT